MEDDLEKEILQRFAEKLLMKKSEIALMLKDRIDSPTKAANEILNGLMSQELVTLAPVGDGTYAITQKGMRTAKA